ncbi:MAG: hypothetical protein K9J50_06110 [Sulfuritalea sp.]|nr:hypothetical protein [Sulfuritalea sp.]
MDTVLVVLVFFFLLVLMGSAVFYYLSLQNLAQMKREMEALKAGAAKSASSSAIRHERARCHQQLQQLESDLATTARETLTTEELSLIDYARDEIKKCTDALKQLNDWMGLPYDQEWVEMLKKLPCINTLYRAAAAAAEAANAQAAMAVPQAGAAAPAPALTAPAKASAPSHHH